MLGPSVPEADTSTGWTSSNTSVGSDKILLLDLSRIG